MSSTIRRALGAFVLNLGFIPFVANAAPIDITAADQGWYRSNGAHLAVNQNYAAGWSFNSEYRNWFVFDLSTIGNVESATLRVSLKPRYQSIDSSETWSLFNISTSVSDVVSNKGLFGSAAGVPIFNDLGTGTLFGTKVVTDTGPGSFVEVTLNAAALNALSNAPGLFAIGGSITTLDDTPNVNERVFAEYLTTIPQAQLVVTESSGPAIVPVPAAVWLFGSGLIGLAGLARRPKSYI